ncbi:N(G),N(G)-dimethylarginine dimethylaminohydrolase 1 [Entophlyctis luteolus]|nr:N(G),N(G)-dimethylarginine dimethylaminohydrolase 1 [Entophlyctis luteolus]
MKAVKAPRTVLCRNLPNSFQSCVTKVDLVATGPIDLHLARQQHDQYVHAIRSTGINVVELSASDEHPDCCFIEDTAVVVGSTAVINRLGHVSRQGEQTATKKALEDLGVVVHDMQSEDGACVDGGDVMLTGNHLFVGLSHRTNEAGARFLEKHLGADGSLRVVRIPMVGDATLHLKCVVTTLAEDVLVVADNTVGREAYAAIRAADARVDAVFVPDEVAANVVVLGGDGEGRVTTVLVQKGFPDSEAAIRARIPADGSWNVVALDMSELIKADGALTCCSILV